MNEIDAYLAQLDKSNKDALERIRRIVKSAVPEAEEVISYGMPGFKLHGKYLFGYAAFKDHLSIFPTSEPVDQLKNELGNFNISKGTVQFRPESPIPEFMIIKLLKIRVKDIQS